MDEKDPQMLTEDQVAAMLGVKPQTLSNWRCQHKPGPPYFKLGLRTVRYDRAAVLAWIQASRVAGVGSAATAAAAA